MVKSLPHLHIFPFNIIMNLCLPAIMSKHIDGFNPVEYVPVLYCRTSYVLINDNSNVFFR